MRPFYNQPGHAVGLLSNIRARRVYFVSQRGPSEPA